MTAPAARRHHHRRSFLAAAVVVIALLAVAGVADQAAADAGDCGVAQTAFSECTAYVAGLEDKVSPRCCMGLGDIRDLAPAAPQRRPLCACILSEMLAAGKVNSGRAAGLPAACGLRLGFIPTGPDFDCSQIP